MDVLISAIIIGPIFTSVALSVYFLDRNFFQYFGSIVGLIQYDLPGVFLENESAGVVNQSLWTIPYELLCYAVMSGIIVCGLLQRQTLLCALSLLFILTPLVIQLSVDDLDRIPKAVASLFFGRGSGSFQCFLVGILAYLYRDRVPYDFRIFAASVAGVLAIAAIGNKYWANSGSLNIALTPMLTYSIMFIGLSKIPPIPLFSRGDYSYGIYLYGYPIQQAVFAMGGPLQRSWMANFIFALIVVTAIAMASWHIIEKPILKLRKKFSFVGRRIADAAGSPDDNATPASPAGAASGS